MSSTSPEPPDSLKAACPNCGARLRVRADKAGRNIACPQCAAVFQLPSGPARGGRIDSRSSVTALAGEASETLGSEPTGDDDQYRLVMPCEEQQYRLMVPEDPPSPVLPNYLDAQAEIKTEPPPPPPEWTFFSGVFTFPWHADVLVRWIFLSVGLTAFNFIGMMIAMLYGGAAGYAGVVLAFFILPIIWISIWTFSYAAALCVTIIEDTAAGNQKTVNWPEPVWKEWAAQLIYVGYLAIGTSVVAYGIARLVHLTGGPFGLSWGVACFLLYPICLLSSMEANSPWVPLTKPIVRSLASLWWGWLVFYALAAAVLGGWLAVVAIGSQLQPFLAGLLGGPILAAALLIYARLLGRLAWRASREES